MINAILGTKFDTRQAFTKTGIRLAVGVVKSGANYVVQVKTEGKDGYAAVQLGFGNRRAKNIKKPVLGHIKKSQMSNVKSQNFIPRFLKEVRTEDISGLDAGSTVSPGDVLKPGDLVSVTGVSKGKGFAGVVKRHGFAGGPKTHGQSDRLRAPGSIGQGTTPGRVYKGKKMAGRMGGERVTTKGLTVLGISEDGMVELSGPIPGSRGSLLIVKKTGENKKFEELYGKQEKGEENGSEEKSDK